MSQRSLVLMNFPTTVVVGFRVISTLVWQLRVSFFALLAQPIVHSVDEKHALVLATRAIGFPVGHASAQQVWRGLRSRPTWRVFCYSAEEPPMRRGLFLVDAINGSVVEKLTEANPDFPESAK